jgi:hypothetical protein
LVAEYARLYSSGSETPYRHEIGERIRPLIAKYGFPEPDKTIEDKFALNGRRGQQPPPEGPAQATLF